MEKIQSKQITNEMLSDLLVRNTNGELSEKIKKLEESYKKN